MSSTPRDYQDLARRRVLNHWGMSSRSVCLVAPTGSGKTFMGLITLESAVRAERRCLWLTHTKDLIEQSSRRVREHFGTCGIIAAGHARTPAPVTVASIQTLLARDHWEPFDVVVFDECFPAGTLVLTPNGERPIETILPGDEVLACNEATHELVARKVLKRSAKSPSTLVTIKTIHGGSVTCTAEHPFLTFFGWKKAIDLDCYDMVLFSDAHHEMSGVRERLRIPATQATKDMLERMSLEGFRPYYGKNESSVRQRADEEEKPDAESRCPSAGIAHAASDRAQAEGSRWQREGTYGLRAGIVASAGVANLRGHSDREETGERVSRMLQGGPGQPGPEGGDRSGREQPLRTGEETSGPQERKASTWARVESVEVHERAGERFAEHLCPDGLVYNFEVEELHTYVADGFVVHNCHHGVAAEWRSVVDRWPHAYLLGLTATPERGDGAGLGDLFKKMVVAAHYSELIRDGHLVPLRVLRPDTRLERGLAKSPLEAYRKRGEGRPGFGWARTIEEARRLAEEFSNAGIPSACVDAGTERDERKRTLEQLDGGRVQIVWSVYATTEGVDIPRASVGILARSFGHASSLLQAAGRILRPHASKQDALLLDLPGVTHEHGIPTQDREYSLTGMPLRKGLAAVKVCQACGYCWDKPGACPRCGFAVREEEPRKPPRIYNAELREVYAGAATPEPAKRAEAQRLLQHAREKGYSDYWARRQYEDLFLEPMPELKELDDVERKKSEYKRLLGLAKERGHAAGWAAWQYKATYGSWPPRSWALSGALHQELQGSR